MTMIEKVAKAICKSRFNESYNWKQFKDDAKAAIEAMREPTEGMYFSVDDYLLDGMQWEKYKTVLEAYSIMIDAALKD